MEELYSKVKAYLKDAGYSLEAISGELDMARSALSAKFLGTRKPFTHPELKTIVKTLAKLEAITTRAQATELLDLAQYPQFTEVEWAEPPLNHLENLDTANSDDSEQAQTSVELPTATETEVLIQVKLYKPQVRAKLVQRPSLSERLASIRNYPLAVVVAPAGFGKTTLTAAWLSSSAMPSAWVTLDQDDHPGRFWRYLLAAVDKFCGKLDYEYFYRQGFGWEQFLPIAINQIAAKATNDFVLVVDDYHLVNAEAITEGMIYLLDHLPPRMHIVLLSRMVPALPLARYRANNHLIEITAEQLRFTNEETGEFLNEVMGLHLPEVSIETLEARTEGWVAGLQLAALSLRYKTESSKLINFFSTDSEFVASYLFEEVFALQSKEVQTFLLETSILGELNSELCEALTGQADSRLRLAQLERSNLFVSRLGADNEWYRYHNLFGDFLVLQAKQTFAAEHVSDLYKAASIWYEQHSYTVEAVTYAILANEEYAITLLERLIPVFMVNGTDLMIQEFMGKISPQAVRSRAKLCIYYAAVLAERRRLEGAEGYLKQAQEILDLAPDVEQITLSSVFYSQLPKEKQTLISELFGVYSIVSGYGFELDKSIKYYDIARKFNLSTDWITVNISIGIGFAFYLHGNIEKAKENFEKASELASSLKLASPYLVCNIYLATVYSRQGQLHNAFARYRKLMSIYENPGKFDAEAAGGIYVSIAPLFYEWNDLGNTTLYLEKALNYYENWRNLQTLCECYIWIARVKQALGFTLEVNDHWQKVEALLEGPNRILVPKEALGWRALLDLQQQNVAKAINWLKDSDLKIDSNDIELHKRNIEHLVMAGVLIAQQDYKSADFLLDRLVNLTRSGGFLTRQLQAIVLQAISFYHQGQKTKAFSAMIHTIELGQPEGYIRSFLDRGFSIEGLLSELLESSTWKRWYKKLKISQQVIFQEYTNKLLWAAQADSTNNPISDNQTSLIV